MKRRSGTLELNPFEHGPPGAPSAFTESDMRRLRNIIKKYGRRTVDGTLVEAAIELDAERRSAKAGRPTTASEDMELADRIYRRADELRKGGSTKPVEDAEREIYDRAFTRSQREGNSHFSKWERKIKNKRLRGLKAWRRLSQSFGELERELGIELPPWLKRNK